MGDLLIWNIPDALKKELADAAARDGNSLSNEATDILREGLRMRQDPAGVTGKSAWDSLRAIFYDENDPQAGEEFATPTFCQEAAERPRTHMLRHGMTAPTPPRCIFALL